LSPITFDSVDIKTHNGPLVVPPSFSLASKDTRLRTSNGRIEGVYNTTNQLLLESTNGPIHANVNLIQLDATAIEKRNVVARTTNGGIQLAYMQHPYGVVLDSLATTTNGDADIKHGLAFEGKFEVGHTVSHPFIYATDGASSTVYSSARPGAKDWSITARLQEILRDRRGKD
jgi:DUF4097 and DUF4098 domain-containing protein YvlB